jgi:hypothetical protein
MNPVQVNASSLGFGHPGVSLLSFRGREFLNASRYQGAAALMKKAADEI